MKSAALGPREWSEEILQQIFRHTPIGVVLTDLHGTILDLNDALCAMVGYPREQIIGQTALSFLHLDEQAETSDFLSRVRDASEGSRRAVRRLQSRSGRTVWVNITLSVVHSREDEPIFGLAFVEDIGERLEMDKALQKSAALYRQVVQDQTEFIVRWLPDGTRTFVNEAYARYFGLSENELLGTSFFPLVVKEDIDAIQAEIKSLTPESPARTGVHRVILADGSVRWNEWTDRATFDESGRITILQSVGRDVTDRIEAMEALKVSESRHRRLFENLPVATWEVDWSEVVGFVRSLGLRSTDEFSAYFSAHPDQFANAVKRVRLCEVNQSALALAEVPDREGFSKWLSADNLGSPEKFIRAVGPLIFDDFDTRHAEITFRTATGRARDVLWRWARVRQSDTGWRVIVIVVDLTEQKRNERELFNQKERLEQAEAMAHLGNWEIDVANWTTSGSREYWRMYDGFEGGPLTRSTDEDMSLIHPEDREAIDEALSTLLNAEPGTAPELPNEWQFRIVRRDGTVRWVRSTSGVKSRPDGLPLVYGVDQDVTEAKQAEDALRRSEQVYRDLFQNIPVAVWETDWSDVLAGLRAEGITTPEEYLEAMSADPARIRAIGQRRRIVEANQKALDLLGVKDVAGLEKATWPPKVAPEQTAVFIRTVANLMFARVPKAIFDLQITRADGTTADVEALMSHSEAAPGHVVNTAVDVSERKKIERELLHSQFLLERAQAIAHLGSWEVSLDDDELFGSREYWNILDGSDEGPRTRKLSETMQIVHPDDREYVWNALRKAQEHLLSGTPSEETVIEMRIVRKDGSLRIVRGQGVFSRTASGEVRGYGIQQDITEIKKAEEAVRRQREELMRADRMISLGILVSGVAHEINNPNQFIMLNAPFLRDAWKDIGPVVDEFAREHPDYRINGMRWSEMKTEIPEILTEIDRGAERIRSIVSELRSFGRDHDPVELRPSSLNDIIEGSLRLLSNHIKRATSNFSTELSSRLPMIKANPQRLEQVVVNLVMNSCQALARPDAAIRVVTSFSNGSVVMKVIDEGLGISAEDLKKIRDPFFTTKRAEGGMGLGLAVSDRIVEEHNGVLSFESEPGRGTTAMLSLPAFTDQER